MGRNSGEVALGTAEFIPEVWVDNSTGAIVDDGKPQTLLERVVDDVAANEPTTATAVWKRFPAGDMTAYKAVVAAMREAEARGFLYRTGSKRGTRWWLGGRLEWERAGRPA